MEIQTRNEKDTCFGHTAQRIFARSVSFHNVSPAEGKHCDLLVSSASDWASTVRVGTQHSGCTSSLLAAADNITEPRRQQQMNVILKKPPKTLQ